VSAKPRLLRPRAVHGSKVRKFNRISDLIDAASDTETVHGYSGGPDLDDQRWLRDELHDAWMRLHAFTILTVPT
jgi:hypothetical protein